MDWQILLLNLSIVTLATAITLVSRNQRKMKKEQVEDYAKVSAEIKRKQIDIEYLTSEKNKLFSELETIKHRVNRESREQPLNEHPRSAIDVINVAAKYVGEPYKWGGTGGTRGDYDHTGFDCSSLISQIYKECGIELTTFTGQIVGEGRILWPEEKIQTGDIGLYGEIGAEWHAIMALDENLAISATPGEMVRVSKIRDFPPHRWIRVCGMAKIVKD